MPILTAQAENDVDIRIGEPWRYFSGSMPPGDWTSISFDDRSWKVKNSGLELEEKVAPTSLLSRKEAVFIRKKFTVRNPTNLLSLVLRVEHEEGFQAYLNGVKIAQVKGRGIILSAPHPATGETEPTLLVAQVDLTRHRAVLKEGGNVIALSGVQSGKSSGAFAIAATLQGDFTRGPFIQNTKTNGTHVIWRTLNPATSWIEYGTNEMFGFAVTNKLWRTNHVFRLTNLVSGTDYFYRVGNRADAGFVVSKTGRFKTFKNSGPVEFLMVGDTGQASWAQDEVARQMLMTPADFVLHGGDIIYGGFNDLTVDTRFFNYYQEQMKSVPFFLAIGNHDLNCCESVPDVNYTNWTLHATNFQNAFYLPTNSVTGTEHFYSFDHGDVHVAVLYNPWFYNYVFTSDNLQYRWLTNDLARSHKPWKFLLLHSPVATVGVHALADSNLNGILDQTELMNLLLPVSQKYGVQLIFGAHDHNFQRFAPTNGLHHVVSGGGGAIVYNRSFNHPGISQHWPVHHFIKVRIQEDRLQLDAIAWNGVVFDSMTMSKSSAPLAVYPSSWNTPAISRGPADDADGNVSGQTFDFRGTGVVARSGKFSNLGEVFVNNDSTNLYVGIKNAMFYQDNQVVLFLESPLKIGVTNLISLGNGIFDANGEGADALDFLENLHFSNFSPSIACILGDEFADSQRRFFARGGSFLGGGQGVFNLDSRFSDVAGCLVQQHNRSPQFNIADFEQNADFMEVAIPLAALGNPGPGTTVRIAAVVAGGLDSNRTDRGTLLDSGFFGVSLVESGGLSFLTAHAFVLSADPDLDQDGLLDEEERRAGTDPQNPDSDGDGLPDGWEVEHDLDPLSNLGLAGRMGDPDGDGVINVEEFEAGTNPRDPVSLLKLHIQPRSSFFKLTWSTVPGKNYELQSANSLDSPFSNVNTSLFPIAASSGALHFDHTNEGRPFQFFRILLRP